MRKRKGVPKKAGTKRRKGLPKKAGTKRRKSTGKAMARGTGRRKNRRIARKSSRKASSGGSITSQVGAYKGDAIGGGIFGVLSRTKLFDLVKLSPNPAARELVGAAAAHFVAPYLPGQAKAYAKDAASAGVAVAAFLLAKNSDVAKSVSDAVDPQLPAQPVNDKFLLE